MITITTFIYSLDAQQQRQGHRAGRRPRLPRQAAHLHMGLSIHIYIYIYIYIMCVFFSDHDFANYDFGLFKNILPKG